MIKKHKGSGKPSIEDLQSALAFLVRMEFDHMGYDVEELSTPDVKVYVVEGPADEPSKVDRVVVPYAKKITAEYLKRVMAVVSTNYAMRDASPLVISGKPQKVPAGFVFQTYEAFSADSRSKYLDEQGLFTRRVASELRDRGYAPLDTCAVFEPSLDCAVGLTPQLAVAV